MVQNLYCERYYLIYCWGKKKNLTFHHFRHIRKYLKLTFINFFFFFFETFPLEGNFNQISDKLYRKLDFKWPEMRILVGTEKIYCCWQFQGSFYSLGSVGGGGIRPNWSNMPFFAVMKFPHRCLQMWLHHLRSGWCCFVESSWNAEWFSLKASWLSLKALRSSKLTFVESSPKAGWFLLKAPRKSVK